MEEQLLSTLLLKNIQWYNNLTKVFNKFFVDPVNE